MEWRIIVPVLCLIGILLVPGNAAQNITDISNSTSGNLTTNQPAPSNQNATTNLTASTNQPAPSNQNATTNLTASTNQPAPSNQNATTNLTASTNQPAPSNQNATTNLTASTNQPAPSNQNATTNLTASTNQPAPSNQNATTNLTASTNQPAPSNQNATTNLTASTNQPAPSNQNATANQNATSSQTASTNQTPNTTSSFNQTTTPATTVSTPAATVSSAPNTASLNLVFRLTQTFKPVFSDLNAPETQQLILEITNTFTPIYKKRFPNLNRMIIQGLRNGSVVTDSVLEFNTTAGTAPNVTDVKDTFISAVNSGNLNFTVDNTSVSVADIKPTSAPTTVSTTNQPASTNQNATANQTASTNQPGSTNQNATANQTASTNQPGSTNQNATANQTASTNQTPNTTSSFNQTTTPATTVSTPAATVSSAPNTASLNLVFRLTQTFKPVFSDLNAPETQQLILEITNTFTPIYKKRFTNFHRMIIRSFRNGSVVTDSVLEFNTTAGTSPNVTDVKDTFISAVNSGNLNFTVDNTSVSVADITPTSAPTTVSTTADSGRSEFNMTFKMNEVFTNELSNISSPQAVTLAKNITTQFDGVLKKRFSNYVDMKIWRFRSGSVIVDSLLGFNKTSTAPTATELVNLIVESAKNGSFTFTVSSLSVTDSTGNTVNRSPVLASMLTALWMTLASLVVSAVMH